MKLITEGEMNEWLLVNGWEKDRFGRIKSAVSVQSYRGDFDISGDVAANVADMFLSQFTKGSISSGLLQVYRIFPVSDPPVRVFQHLLELYGFPNVPATDFRLRFSNEYDCVLATIAWSMACAWEITFVANDRHFAIETDEDDRITVSWGIGVELAPEALQIVQGWERLDMEENP